MRNFNAYAVVTPPSLWGLRSFLSGVLWSWLIALGKIPFYFDILKDADSSKGRRQVVYALDKGVRKGRLELFDPVIGKRSFGEEDSPAAVLNVTNDRFWLRVLFSYDIGFSEAYMAGDFETANLKQLLDLYVDNLDHLGELASPFYRLLRFKDILVTYFLGYSISKSVENVAGYNASNDMYRAFLSKEMMYSCPIWGNEEGGVRGDLEGRRAPGDLEMAQSRKIEHILKKARIFPGARLLEIGTGWGALSIAAAKMGCYVDTITISIEQQRGAQENIQKAGVQDRVKVHFMDYRHLPPEFEKAFDACVSTEMLEAVGMRNMKLYLSQIDWALKTEKSFVVLTSTSYPEATYTRYQGNDFTRKYHWPNGVSPSPTSLLRDFERYVPRQFCVDNVEDLGDHALMRTGRRNFNIL